MATLSLLFFLFLSSPDVLKGTVQDPTGAVIPGARIEVTHPGLARDVVTDKAGQFVFDELPSGDYSLIATAPGFSPNVVSISVPGDAVTLTLRVAPRGEEVSVTATRMETPLSMVGVSATIIDRDQIVQKQSPPVYDLLRDISGVAVSNTSRRGGLTSLYTRGGGSEANLVLVDGIQVNEPGGDFNFAHLTTANVDRIELVRGPQSPIYGSNAAAAAIQVVSHQGSSEDGIASGSGSFEGGTFSTYRYRAGTSGMIKKLDYSWAAERLGTKGAYVNDSYRNLSVAGNIGYRLNDSSHVRLTLRRIGSWVGVPNQVDYGVLDRNAFESATSFIGGARYEQNTERFSEHVQLGFVRSRDYYLDSEAAGPFTIGAIVTGTPGARGSAGVRLVRLLSPAELMSANPVVPPGGQLAETSVSIYSSPPFEQITERRTAEYQGNWNYSRHNSLSFGYDLAQERGISDAAPPLRNNHGLFVNHQQAVGTRLFLTESVRFEDNSSFGKKTTPRLAASYFLSANTRLKASAGTGISEPSFLESYANDPTFVGNRSLKPERSESVEAGIEQHFWHSRIVTDATFFGNRFRDLIVFEFLPPPQPSTWINLDASRAEGLELNTRSQLGWLQLRGQYTFMNTRVTATQYPSDAGTGVGQELLRRPRHSGAVDVSATLRRAFVNLNTTFVGERQDSDGIGLGIVRNPRYEKVSLGGRYTVRPSIDLFVRVDNLLNRRYEEVLGYPALSRNALVGVTFRFRYR
jgi:outer membrane cobalamin receptor